MKKSALLLAAAVCFQVLSFGAAPRVSPDPKDPQYQAKGAQRRTYAFPGTGESIPYRLYVPMKWTKGMKLPLLVELHAGNTIDNPFTRKDDILERLAEERGYIVVAPMGYHPDGTPYYNSPFKIAPNPKAETAAPANAKGDGKAKAAPAGPTAEERQRAEEDVLNVIDLMAQEYSADMSRVYMHGNNFAGSGVMYLAEKYPERFAAIAVSSAPIVTDQYPFERLKNGKIGFMIVHGEQDTTNSFEAAQKMADVAKAKGVEVAWTPVKDGTHLESWAMVFPQMLDYFDKHKK